MLRKSERDATSLCINDERDPIDRNSCYWSWYLLCFFFFSIRFFRLEFRNTHEYQLTRLDFRKCLSRMNTQIHAFALIHTKRNCPCSNFFISIFPHIFFFYFGRIQRSCARIRKTKICVVLSNADSSGISICVLRYSYIFMIMFAVHSTRAIIMYMLIFADWPLFQMLVKQYKDRISLSFVHSSYC